MSQKIDSFHQRYRNKKRQRPDDLDRKVGPRRHILLPDAPWICLILFGSTLWWLDMYTATVFIVTFTLHILLLWNIMADRNDVIQLLRFRLPNFHVRVLTSDAPCREFDLKSLPPRAWLSLFQYLSARELSRLQVTCKQLNYFVHYDGLSLLNIIAKSLEVPKKSLAARILELHHQSLGGKESIVSSDESEDEVTELSKPLQLLDQTARITRVKAVKKLLIKRALSTGIGNHLSGPVDEPVKQVNLMPLDRSKTPLMLRPQYQIACAFVYVCRVWNFFFEPLTVWAIISHLLFCLMPMIVIALIRMGVYLLRYAVLQRCCGKHKTARYAKAEQGTFVLSMFFVVYYTSLLDESYQILVEDAHAVLWFIQTYWLSAILFAVQCVVLVYMSCFMGLFLTDPLVLSRNRYISLHSFIWYAALVLLFVPVWQVQFMREIVPWLPSIFVVFVCVSGPHRRVPVTLWRTFFLGGLLVAGLSLALHYVIPDFLARSGEVDEIELQYFGLVDVLTPPGVFAFVVSILLLARGMKPKLSRGLLLFSVMPWIFLLRLAMGYASFELVELGNALSWWMLAYLGMVKLIMYGDWSVLAVVPSIICFIVDVVFLYVNGDRGQLYEKYFSAYLNLLPTFMYGFVNLLVQYTLPVLVVLAPVLYVKEYLIPLHRTSSFPNNATSSYANFFVHLFGIFVVMGIATLIEWSGIPAAIHVLSDVAFTMEWFPVVQFIQVALFCYLWLSLLHLINLTAHVFFTVSVLEHFKAILRHIVDKSRSLECSDASINNLFIYPWLTRSQGLWHRLKRSVSRARSGKVERRLAAEDLQVVSSSVIISMQVLLLSAVGSALLIALSDVFPRFAYPSYLTKNTPYTVVFFSCFRPIWFCYLILVVVMSFASMGRSTAASQPLECVLKIPYSRYMVCFNCKHVAAIYLIIFSVLFDVTYNWMIGANSEEAQELTYFTIDYDEMKANRDLSWAIYFGDAGYRVAYILWALMIESMTCAIDFTSYQIG